MRFKECGYVPRKAKAVSVTITKRAGKYFASFLFEINTANSVSTTQSEGIGIDLGIKSFAVISDGRNYPNINKTERARSENFHARYRTSNNERRKLQVKSVSVPTWTNRD